MDLALLLLRLLLSCMLIGHGLQKSVGLFHGIGLRSTAALFEQWGFRPGRQLVVLASLCEVSAGALFLIGLATPLASVIAIATMTVASAPNLRNGFWAARGGWELSFVYAALAAVLGFSGGGGLSIDRLLHVPSGWLIGVVVVVAGVLAATPPLVVRRLKLRPEV